MDSAVLTDLLARVEGATGADRELDAAIGFATGWLPRDRDHYEWIEADGTFVQSINPKPFTSSLDASLALAKRLGFYIRSEPRFHIDGERVNYISHALRPHWDRWRPDDEWFDRGEAKHADQTLSALAALLKALQAQASEHTVGDGTRTKTTISQDRSPLGSERGEG